MKIIISTENKGCGRLEKSNGHWRVKDDKFYANLVLLYREGPYHTSLVISLSSGNVLPSNGFMNK